MDNTPTEYDIMRHLANTYWDCQKHRIALGNRNFSGAATEQLTNRITELAETTENEAAKVMRAYYRKNMPPEIVEWQRTTVGIGEHLLARLLGAIGHPCIAVPYHWEGEGRNRELVADEPYRRKVSQLWSYCGHGDPNRRRRTGMSAVESAAMGNPDAKMLVRLIAGSIVKSGVRRAPGVEKGEPFSPGTRVAATVLAKHYLMARERYQDREGWSAGRQQNASLRLVGKEMLRDLYNVALPEAAIV